MSRPRRSQAEHQINADLPLDLIENLQAFCDATRMKRKQVIELAIRRLLNERQEAANGSPS